MNKILVFTDLDGTLLNRTTYDYQAALPLIAHLKQRGISVIMNSSKTLVELRTLNEKLNTNPIFVYENGGGIFIQKGQLDCREDTQLNLGTSYAKILAALRPLKNQFNFRGFSDLSIQDVVKETNLSQTEAAQAKERAFTEPLLWHDDDLKLVQFTSLLAQQKLKVLAGGRFLHIQGNHDKASAMQSLVSRCQKAFSSVTTIALGDAENDRKMLEAADHAIVLPVANKNRLNIQHDSVTYAKLEAPQGWRDSLEQVVNSLVGLS